MRSIDPVLLRKIKEQNQTIYNNAQPKMKVSVARAKNTVMDSTYWTVETIRQTTGLGDVSVAPRRFKSYGRPNRIYEIHVKDGEVITSIREYPDKLREGFKNQFSLGLGTSVAVAFNGEWERYRKFYRLVTEEKPWISWVDNNGYLWTQRWDETETRMQLSSNVVKVRMIRAWKNTAIHYLDQGIVAAYIKTDGKVYYRNLCMQENYTEAWEYEKELTGFTGTAVNVNLFITNDYRMGFIIEDNSGQIHWLVTVRNWGGMASPAESIATSIKDITLNVIPIKYHETHAKENIGVGISEMWFNVAEQIYPEPMFAENPDKSIEQILLKFNYEIADDIDLSTVGEAFKIRDSLNANFTILDTQAGADNSEIIFTCAVFGGASGNMFITYDRTILELDCLNQGSRFAIESFDFEFTPDLAPPEGYALEYLNVSLPVTFEVKQVYYAYANNGNENLSARIDITFEVTKVGNNPL